MFRVDSVPLAPRAHAEVRRDAARTATGQLTVDGLACSRGDRRLFEGIGFELGAGEWLHVRGENGAGKTTLLRTLVGLAPPDCGRVRWRGEDVRALGARWRRDVVYLGHQAALKDELSALENLDLALRLDGCAQPAEALLDGLRRVGLEGREELSARALSAGQRRRLLLARLLLRPAPLWVLDEPSAALDGAGVELLLGMVGRHLADGGVAVLTGHQPIPLPRRREVSL